MFKKDGLLRQKGFTIVELLIVVVVIAILAAITIVAYNGIQNNTNDSAIKADLSSLAKKVEAYRVDDTADQYPTLTAHLATLSIKPSRGSYIVTGNNLLYCRSTDGKSWAAAGVSRSGKAFVVGSGRSMGDYVSSYVLSTGLGSQTNVCPEILTSNSQTSGNSWGYTGGSWQSSWIN